MRDAGHEHAHGRETLLTDNLPLKRLHRLAHLALLFELLFVRGARLAQARRHHHERFLQLPAFEVVRGALFRRREVAFRDELRDPAQPIQIERRLPGDPQRQRDDADEREAMMSRFLRQSGASRARTSDRGMATLSSHGPRSMTALP